MTDPRVKRRVPPEVIVGRLDMLMAHGSISTWRRDGYAWFVTAGAEFGPYDAREIAAWVDGARAMGAGERAAVRGDDVIGDEMLRAAGIHESLSMPWPLSAVAPRGGRAGGVGQTTVGEMTMGRFTLDRYEVGDKSISLRDGLTNFRADIDVDDVDVQQVLTVAALVVETLNGAGMAVTGSTPYEGESGCVHDSARRDGTLDDHCQRCGADGYWHEGHRHDEVHPSGKLLVRLGCEVVA